MRLRWAIFLAVLGLGAAVYVTTWRREVAHRQEVQAYLAQKQEEARAAQDQLARRKDHVEFLKTPEGQAWAARRDLNMAFPGEKIYRLDDGSLQEPKN
ncbi:MULTISPECIES: FtsB family cell division protein [Jonquetella]|uniref:Septum formation initiator n=1 Tax=Jonquetella anthropi DSM 22815 TaxID=885272 RepID=H0ULV1_9BACT|nr:MULTISPECIES: cell division protein [Jonquetella]EEX48158.1 hypothetical protein GCWU000246_01477 [Jonquetella anthropi E3_33 E1]EHM13592.1 Septum formation initiator [Jonquetella anthropi DSM 22815]ERL24545.1 septum formation initiator [Jonquetella sp. BV3C21]